MKLLHSIKSLWKISPILLIGAVAAFAAACGGEEKVVTEIQTVIVEKPVTQIEKVVETVVVERVVEGKTVTEVQTVVVEKAVVAQPTRRPQEQCRPDCVGAAIWSAA